MKGYDNLETILDQIKTGKYTFEELGLLAQILRDGEHQNQPYLGKYNIYINEGQGIHIGDRTYITWTHEAIQALIQAIREPQQDSQDDYLSSETCRERQALDQYLEATVQRLRQQGCLDIRHHVIYKGQMFNTVARIADLELLFGVFSMRGEAFFMFSEFNSIQMSTLCQFSAQCLQWSREQIDPNAAGQALFNARVPTHICFAIALVDNIAPNTGIAVQTTNPFDRRVDLLWYEVPIVYDLSQQQLYFYEKAASFWDNFKGEIVWQKLRSLIQQTLAPVPQSDHSTSHS